MKKLIKFILFLGFLSNFCYSQKYDTLGAIDIIETQNINQVYPPDSNKIEFLNLYITDNYRIVKSDYRLFNANRGEKDLISFKFPVYDGGEILKLQKLTRLTKEKPCFKRLSVTREGEVISARLNYPKAYLIIKKGTVVEYGFYKKGSVWLKYDLSGFIDSASWPVKIVNKDNENFAFYIISYDGGVYENTIYYNYTGIGGINVKSVIDKKRSRELKFRHENIICN